MAKENKKQSKSSRLRVLDTPLATIFLLACFFGMWLFLQNCHPFKEMNESKRDDWIIL